MGIKGLATLAWLLVFSGIAFGQTFQVDVVQVDGTQRVAQKTVRAVVKSSPGEEVTAADIDEDIRAIYGLGSFEEVTADISERDGQTVLSYIVRERPLLRKVNFDGNEEFDQEKMRSLCGIRTPALFDPVANNACQQQIRQAYLQEGYHGIELSQSLDINERREGTLEFTVTEGDKVLVDGIAFEGNTVFTEKELQGFIETRERWFLSWLTGRGAFNEEILQNDLELIADRYYDRGYVQVKVKQPLVTLSEDKTLLDVLIEIDEGEQFFVGKVDVAGDLLQDKSELLDAVRVKEGDVFSRKELRTSVFALNDIYADLGYAYVNVSPLTRVDPETLEINVTFEIEQGVQVRVDRIRISGNTKTRDKVIRRELKLVEGDLYSASKMKESRRRVNNLGFFEEVNITTARGNAPDRMDLDVEVAERATGTFSLGFGYSSVDGLVGQGSISQENFLGRALKLNLAGSFGGSSTTYQVGLLDPYFLDKNLSLGFDLYNTEREWTDFTKKTQGGDVKLGLPVGTDTRAFFIYRYEEKEILDVDPQASNIIREQAGTSTLSSIFASLTRDTTDYRLDPSRGSVTEGSVELAGLGGTEKFAKYILDYRHFVPFKWSTVFSLHGQVGYVHEIGGEDIPIDERFFLGGINSLRGFNSREVGPKEPRLEDVPDPDNNQMVQVPSGDFDYLGGTKSAYFNAELIFPLLKDAGMKGVLFFDTGNAWGEEEQYFEEMRYSAGAGIRWFSPMGPLRLEWGYNLDPVDSEPQSRFEFSIGRFF